MTASQTASTSASTTEGTVEWQGLRTWYRVVRGHRPDPARLPVVICHGGPGLTHDYLTPVAKLSRSGRDCVLYDQYGSGRSGRLCDVPPGFWTVDLFLRELDSLTRHLGIAGGYHLVGHSWGGMLALELALRRPPGLRSVVAADTFASAATYTAEVARLLRDLPPDVQATIERHETTGTTDAAGYQEAVRVFYRRHVYRRTPVPDELRRTLTALAHDSTVYTTMAGPSEFSLTGSLRDWDLTGRLPAVEVPVLLVSGRHDEVTPGAVDELRRGLTSARWVLFEESSHMPHLEEPERFLAVVAEFLADAERVTAPG